MDGYRRNYYSMLEPKGFYHPMMKGPAYAQGINSLLRDFLMIKQFKQEQKEKDWARGMEEKKFGPEEELEFYEEQLRLERKYAPQKKAQAQKS